MTHRATAARLRRPRLRSRRRGRLCAGRAAVIGRYRTCQPTVSERLVCPGGVCRRCACAPLSKSTRAHHLWVQCFHDPHAELQRDKLPINVRLILLPIAAWHVDNSGLLCMHRVRLALSQVKALSWLWPCSGIPSISTAYAQARRRCAQVVHMFVHRQQGSSPGAGAGRQQRLGAPVLACPASRPDSEDLAPAWMGSPEEGSHRMIAVGPGPGPSARTRSTGRLTQPMTWDLSLCPTLPASGPEKAPSAG